MKRILFVNLKNQCQDSDLEHGFGPIILYVLSDLRSLLAQVYKLLHETYGRFLTNVTCYVRVTVVEAGLCNLLQSGRTVVQLITVLVKSQAFLLISEKDGVI